MPWKRAWQPTPVSLPGEPRGQKSLVGYSPRGHQASHTTGQLSTQGTGPLWGAAGLTGYWGFQLFSASFIPHKHPKVTPGSITPGHIQMVFRKMLSSPRREPGSIEGGGGWREAWKGAPHSMLLEFSPAGRGASRAPLTAKSKGPAPTGGVWAALAPWSRLLPVGPVKVTERTALWFTVGKKQPQGNQRTSWKVSWG